MESRAAMDGVEESEEFLLLEAYCTRRNQRSLQSGFSTSSQGWACSFFADALRSPVPCVVGSVGVVGPPVLDRSKGQDASSLSDVADRLAQIADSASISQADLTAAGLEDQDEIVKKLVELLKTSGDVMDEQIKQNEVLQERLKNVFDYALFEKLTSSLQSLVDLGQAGSKDRIQREKIAWAFEVTSRLSAVDVVHRRRALSFGERYLRQHHSAWIQQHGGWEKAFDSDDID
ncbi:apoptosis facilitator Bcl-2-like protein 14 [Centroberyx affinis]|uniref:apoptosis facilitator Bcl-2-like protein 14 n=1 Tax=Centroberyx affinis TaxID=166261 RepID=UPI003A5BFBFA